MCYSVEATQDNDWPRLVGILRRPVIRSLFRDVIPNYLWITPKESLANRLFLFFSELNRLSDQIN